MSAEDADNIIVDEKNIIAGGGDLSNIIWDAISAPNYKIALLLMLVFILLSSTVFIDNIMSGFSSAVDGSRLTNYGIILQGGFLALAYILLDILVRQEII